MDYASLLRDYITKSGLSLSQIASELNKKGFSTDKGYISKLQNAKNPPAGEPMNKALAEITGGDPDRLLWYAYVEKAPEDIKGLLSSIKDVDKLYDHVIDLYVESLTEDGKILPEFSEHLYDILKPRYGDTISSESFRDPSYFKSGFKKMEIESKANMLEFLINNYFDEEERDIFFKNHSSGNGNIPSDLYDLYLYNAKNIINDSSQRNPEQTMIKSAIIMAFQALELRVGEVLYKYITSFPNADEEWAFDSLKRLPLREKINGPLKKNFDLKQLTFGDFEDLLSFTDLIPKIMYGKHTDEISGQTAKGLVELVEKTIKSIDENAREMDIK
jgi:transcriptional regulator with XRE-family HTH domain